MADTRDSFMLPLIKCSSCNADVQISQMGDHVCAKESGSSPAPPAKALSLSSPFNEQRKPSGASESRTLSQAIHRNGRGATSIASARTDAGRRRSTELFNIDCAFPPVGPKSPTDLHSPTAGPSFGRNLYQTHQPRELEDPHAKQKDISGHLFSEPAEDFVKFSIDRHALDTPLGRRPSVEPLPAVAAQFPHPGPDHSFNRTNPRETSGTIRFKFEDIQPPGNDWAGQSSGSHYGASQLPLRGEHSRSRNDTEETLGNGPPSSHGGAARHPETNRSDTLPALPKLDTSTSSTKRANAFPEKSDYSLKSPGSRVPPHPGLGLPRTPSQTVKSHLRKKNSLAKALPPPPEPSPPLPPLPPPSMRSNSPMGSRLGDEVAKAKVNRARSPSPRRPVSPPKEKRPPPRKPYVEQSEDQGRSTPPGLHTSKYSVSSNGSTAYSGASTLPDTPFSSPPSSDVSVSSKDANPRFHEPRTLQDVDHRYQPAFDAPPAPIRGKNHVGGGPPAYKHELAGGNSEGYVLRKDNSAPQAQARPMRDENRPFGGGGFNPGFANHTPQVDQSSGPSLNRHDTGNGYTRVPTSKGPCRGCGQQIYGKSISSADGRLTGRYHKQCFTCQACRSPFQSAEFYVLDNMPYCERHYHQLNHSLCPTCDRGIEGPCLETDRKERFHPRCFTCFQCHCILGDYFEINGKPFCERHAQRAMRVPRGGGGPGYLNGNARMERRKTRMMHMDSAAPPPMPVY